MEIISHRGYWKAPSERNTKSAFLRSFLNGFGAEIDIRDFNGELVISHDIPDSSAMSLDCFFGLLKNFKSHPVLAINIKADGLQNSLRSLLDKFRIDNYFLFDMAVPDGLKYCELGFKVFTRHSDVEPIPPYYDEAYGVWMDELREPWIEQQIIKQHLSNGKKVCIVSPELHLRQHLGAWEKYKSLEDNTGKGGLMLCTDFPIEAKEYFDA